jgi:hypothetical protein
LWKNKEDPRGGSHRDKVSRLFQLSSHILCDAGTGRNEVPLRFTRHSNIYSIDEFSDPTILKIFGTEISWHFQEIIS